MRSSGTNFFIYDSDGNLLAETDADGVVLREYVYLDGQRLALFDLANSDAVFYYINDHLGTAQILLDNQGTVVWQGNYRPFGQVEVVVNNVANYFRFPGQIFDVESGLHYNWNRYYNPKTGRYISADPIGLDGGLNLYAYVDGDPVNDFDQAGLRPCYGKTLQECQARCRAQNEEILICEEVDGCELDILFVVFKGMRCTCTGPGEYGGLKPGKPNVPYGSEKIGPREIEKITSQNIKDFLRNHDISTKGWKKVMEKWKTPKGNIIKRHWWEGPGGRSFHHI